MKERITNRDIAQSLLIRRGVRTYRDKMLLRNHLAADTRVAQGVMDQIRGMITELPESKYDISGLNLQEIRAALVRILQCDTGN